MIIAGAEAEAGASAVTAVRNKIFGSVPIARFQSGTESISLEAVKINKRNQAR